MKAQNKLTTSLSPHHEMINETEERTCTRESVYCIVLWAEIWNSSVCEQGLKMKF